MAGWRTPISPGRFCLKVCIREDFHSIDFSCNDDKLWKQVRSLLGVFPNFFSYLSSFENERDGKREG